MQQKVNPCLEIAIIGMACRFPGATTCDEFWSLIINKKEAMKMFTEEELLCAGIPLETSRKANYVKAKPCLEGVENFDADFFGFSKKVAQFLDPQVRLFLQESYHALEDAAYYPDHVRGPIGVFAGASTDVEWTRQILKELHGMTDSEAFELWVMSCKDFLSQIVSYRLNLTGPSYTLYTSCSTSLTAVHLACQALILKECDLALAGGVTIDLPARAGYLYEPGMIHSPTGRCAPCDASANGTVFGDGVGVIVLKRLDEALLDRDKIYAVIKGSHVNNDGRRKAGFFAPSAFGQKEVLEQAVYRAGVTADSIQYIEMHGTGTSVGDAIEIKGLKEAHAQRTTPCAIGSVKANIGHLHAGAGIAGLIKTTLALYYRTIPPMTNFEKLHSNIEKLPHAFYIPKERKSWPKVKQGKGRAGISSFGIGGSNVHLILEQPPTRRRVQSSGEKIYCFPFSAKSSTALDRLLHKFTMHLEKNPSLDLASAAFSLQVGRGIFPYRKAIVASTQSKLLAYMETLLPNHRACQVKPFILGISDDILSNPCENLDILCKHIWGLNQFYQHCIKSLPMGLSEEKMKQAKILISHVVGVKSILLRGLTPQKIVGFGGGVYIAALLENPKEWDKLLTAYYQGEGIPNSLWNKERCDLIYGRKGTEFSPLFISPRQLIEEREIMMCLASLWEAGIAIDWQLLYQKNPGREAPLPLYPFEEKPCWFNIAALLQKNEPQDKHRFVSNLFEETLKVGSIQDRDNFFSLGGDSLQLSQMMSRINRHYAVEISPFEIYQQPTVENIVMLLTKYTT